MARYVRKFLIKDDLTPVYNIINTYLLGEGYKTKILNGEKVYKKGSGAIKEPNYFKFTVCGNALTMETWTAFSVIPEIDICEYDLNAPWYIFKEKGWSNRVLVIENLLVNQLGCTITF